MLILNAQRCQQRLERFAGQENSRRIASLELLAVRAVEAVEREQRILPSRVVRIIGIVFKQQVRVDRRQCRFQSSGGLEVQRQVGLAVAVLVIQRLVEDVNRYSGKASVSPLEMPDTLNVEEPKTTIEIAPFWSMFKLSEAD